MNDLIVFAILLISSLPIWWAVWQSGMRCKILRHCEPPKGKYCGYCGKRQPTQASGEGKHGR